MPFNQTLTCQEITSIEDFAGLRETWQNVFDSCDYPSLFSTWDWAWQWWQHLGAPDPLKHQLLIVTATDPTGLVVGIAPFCYPTHTKTRIGLPSPRPLRPLGNRVRCRMEDMTEEPILVLRNGFEASAVQAILAHLRRHQANAWDLTHVRVVRKRDTVNLSTLWKNLGHHWSLIHQRTEIGQLVILPDSWPLFLKSLNRSMRRNVTYYPRLLARDGHKWTIHTARTPNDIEGAINTLIALHHRRSQSHKGVPHRDHIPGPQFESFFRDVIAALAAQGHASIVLMEINGITIAAQAVLESGPMLTFYYSGFDPTWSAYSPVTLLNVHVIQEAIARGFALVNYLPGAAPWKTRWGTTDTYVVDDLSWIPMRPRPIVAALTREWRRQRESPCECGFCSIPISPTEAPEENDLRSEAAISFECTF